MSKIMSKKNRKGDKCQKCGKPAEYDSPAILCGECWAKWWVAGMGAKNKKESAEIMRETMAIVEEARRADGFAVPGAITCGKKSTRSGTRRGSSRGSRARR
jgi:hypothetical protein